MFLENRSDTERAVQMLLQANGVEEVYPTEEAARKFRLHRERIGDIFVLADKDTVFGELDVVEETVSVRSHGSRHESYVPVIGYNSPWTATDFDNNVDVGRPFFSESFMRKTAPTRNVTADFYIRHQTEKEIKWQQQNNKLMAGYPYLMGRR